MTTITGANLHRDRNLITEFTPLFDNNGISILNCSIGREKQKPAATSVASKKD